VEKCALAITEKVLGPDNPRVGEVLHNLARVYEAQGRYPEAELLLKRALAITEKALGPDNADVGARLNNLAWLYTLEGRYAETAPLLKRALAIDRTLFRNMATDVPPSGEKRAKPVGILLCMRSRSTCSYISKAWTLQPRPAKRCSA
jgi:tetratricopeptide (TPR) repeat protein